MRGRDAWRAIAIGALAAWCAAGCAAVSSHDLTDAGATGKARIARRAPTAPRSTTQADFATAEARRGASSGRAERVGRAGLDRRADEDPVEDRADERFGRGAEPRGRVRLVSTVGDADGKDESPLPPDPKTEKSDKDDADREPMSKDATSKNAATKAGTPKSATQKGATQKDATESRSRRNAAPRAGGLQLDEVLGSVRRTYPLLAVAYESRRIAEGEQRESWGEFDLKLKSTLIRQPQGYYENYRRSVGFEQPTYFGGQVFGGYRLVRGDVEPWYQERVTNRDGEFSGGFLMPLLQGRRIDPRRAELWKATYGRTLTEYEIQEQGIDFTLGASLAYWDWVAAGETLRLAEELLRLAEDRVEFLEKQIELDRQPPIARVDNQRLIVSRQAKRIEAQQKLRQSAVKLSLFLRTADGEPLVPTDDLLPALPEPEPVDPAMSSDAAPIALQNRPELRQLIVLRKQLEVDRALAKNMTEPSVNASVYWSKDIGDQADPRKKFDDKEPLTTEATLQVDVPLQRRKARGKMQAVEGKLAQNAAKRTFTENKITSEVQAVHVALEAAWQTYERAVEAVRLNERLERAEQTKLELQRSDLLLLNLREQATFDARLTEVVARLQYHQAQAARRAVLAIDAGSFADPDCVPTREEY